MNESEAGHKMDEAAEMFSRSFEYVETLRRIDEEYYPQYNLFPRIASERMFMIQVHGCSREEIIAFTIANKGDDAFAKGKESECERMGYHALQFDPRCLDAWRILARLMNLYMEGDTIAGALRETLVIGRELYNQLFEATGKFYKISLTRPYMRILHDIADIARQGDKCDTAIFAYEELIRLNHWDSQGNREHLLGLYLKMIGRKLRGDTTIPVRTIEQAEELMKAKLSGSDLEIWGENPGMESMVYRWAQMLIKFAKNDESWKDMAREDYEDFEWIFDFIFRKIEYDPQADNERGADYIIMNLISDWPEFVIQVHDLVKKPNKKFNKKIRDKTPDIQYLMSRENKANKIKMMVTQFLDVGREKLTNKEYNFATKMFAMARRNCIDQALPSHRWYLNAPFAIASNRATCSANMGRWHACRFDTRFTLLMKPDHMKTYERLPKIIKAYKVPQIEAIFSEMKEEIGGKAHITQGEWSAYAAKAIALLSVSAIVQSKLGKLTDEKIEELILIGIEDAFTSVNVPLDYHPILPWLTEEDLESI